MAEEEATATLAPELELAGSAPGQAEGEDTQNVPELELAESTPGQAQGEDTQNVTAAPVLDEETAAAAAAPATHLAEAEEAIPPAPTPPAATAATAAATTPPNVSPDPGEPETKVEVKIEEAQNALTQKFTDDEWEALYKLRSELPSIFAEAFPDREGAGNTPIVLWGVTIDPNVGKATRDARVSVVLMKFLRARNLSVQEARSKLVSTLRWRDSFKPEETLKEEFPADIFGQLGYVYGQDKGGRPVTYNLYGANKDLKAVFGDIPRFLRWRVSLMEKGIGLLDFETTDQMVQIHDYEGVSLSSRDANSKNAASEATSIFSAHYPELLYKKFFVNVPTLMTWIFWVFKPLLSSQTIAKMSVAGSGPTTIGRAVLPYVGAEELPERYGGKAKAF